MTLSLLLKHLLDTTSDHHVRTTAGVGMKHVASTQLFKTSSMNLTPELLKAYKEYLAEFDPSPIGNGEDYLYPLSEDAFVEELLEAEESN